MSDHDDERCAECARKDRVIEQLANALAMTRQSVIVTQPPVYVRPVYPTVYPTWPPGTITCDTLSISGVYTGPKGQYTVN